MGVDENRTERVLPGIESAVRGSGPDAVGTGPLARLERGGAPPDGELYGAGGECVRAWPKWSGVWMGFDQRAGPMKCRGLSG